jgi:hypothetical protein
MKKEKEHLGEHVFHGGRDDLNTLPVNQLPHDGRE